MTIPRMCSSKHNSSQAASEFTSLKYVEKPRTQSLTRHTSLISNIKSFSNKGFYLRFLTTTVCLDTSQLEKLAFFWQNLEHMVLTFWERYLYVFTYLDPGKNESAVFYSNWFYTWFFCHWLQCKKIYDGPSSQTCYLTMRFWARDFYHIIIDEGEFEWGSKVDNLIVIV